MKAVAPAPGGVTHACRKDTLPLHRQERIFLREGISLSRSTLCGFVQGAVATLTLIVNAMWADTKANAPIVLTDATGVLIRHAEKCRRGHFQVFIAPARHVVFKFLQSLNGSALADALEGFVGKLQSDAASVYHEIYVREPDVIEVGCWAHARRYFFEALTTDRARALAAIGMIGDLYQAHRDATDSATGLVDGEKRRQLAQKVLADLVEWRRQVVPTLDPQTAIAKAFGYLQRQWGPLTAFLDDGRLRLDNNPSELELRHQAVGRKNWLFCASESGAIWNSVVVSLIASCRMHKVEPWAYLRDVLTIVQAWPQTRVLELAPAFWNETRQKPEMQQMLKERQLVGRGQGVHEEKPGSGAA